MGVEVTCTDSPNQATCTWREMDCVEVTCTYIHLTKVLARGENWITLANTNQSISLIFYLGCKMCVNGPGIQGYLLGKWKTWTITQL